MNTENLEAEEIYILTPCGCLILICHKYGISLDHLTQAEVKNFYEDFIGLLQKIGYLSKEEERSRQKIVGGEGNA